MLHFKKAGFQSHIYVILLISAIMSFLLVFLLSGIYGKDNTKCLDVNFEIQDLCKHTQTSVSFILSSQHSESLKFNINSNRLPTYFTSPNGDVKIMINLNGENILSVIPIIADGNYDYECVGKKQTKNTEVVKKC